MKGYLVASLPAEAAMKEVSRWGGGFYAFNKNDALRSGSCEPRSNARATFLKHILFFIPPGDAARPFCWSII